LVVSEPLPTHSGDVPAKIIKKPENKTLIEDSKDCFIEAIVDGNPFPTCQWFKGARECFSGPKYTHEKNEKTGVIGLKFNRLRPEDESKYKLKIKNSSGSEEASFSLFVKCNLIILMNMYKNEFLNSFEAGEKICQI